MVVRWSVASASETDIREKSVFLPSLFFSAEEVMHYHRINFRNDIKACQMKQQEKRYFDPWASAPTSSQLDYAAGR